MMTGSCSGLWVFGVDPTEWLLQFSHPFITEVLQIAYTLFYFLFC
jgi:hypothetical protein